MSGESVNRIPFGFPQATLGLAQQKKRRSEVSYGMCFLDLTAPANAERARCYAAEAFGRGPSVNIILNR